MVNLEEDILKVVFKTDCGRKRQVNQDVFYENMEGVGSLPNLFFVCDGMGGEKAGGYASDRARQVIIDYIKTKNDKKQNMTTLSMALKVANLDLYNKQLSEINYEGMGTTFVGGYIENDKLIVANVGDSRCYHIRADIKQVTHDHSLVEELVKQGEITRDSQAYKEQKNVITKALGAENSIRPDFFEVELFIGDYILLCSDGLSNMLTDEEILQIVNFENKSLEEKVDLLINEANYKGGKDNITVGLIEFKHTERMAQ